MSSLRQMNGTPAEFPPAAVERDAVAHSRRAFRILQFAYVAAPVLAGADKFFHLLTNWDKYLPPLVDRMVGGHGHTLMLAVGVVEIAAGIGVALRPRIFGYVVAAWLWAIILNLLLIPGYFDVALRDFGLSLGALALAQLSMEHGRR